MPKNQSGSVTSTSMIRLQNEMWKQKNSNTPVSECKEEIHWPTLREDGTNGLHAEGFTGFTALTTPFYTSSHLSVLSWSMGEIFCTIHDHVTSNSLLFCYGRVKNAHLNVLKPKVMCHICSAQDALLKNWQHIRCQERVLCRTGENLSRW